MSRDGPKGWADIVDFEDEDTPVEAGRSVEEEEPVEAESPPRSFRVAHERSSAPPQPSPAASVAPSGRGLRLPAGSSGARRAAPAAPTPVAGFSQEEFVEKLSDGEPAARGRTAPSGFWQEYREVVLTGLGGAALLALVLGYRSFGSGDDSDGAAPAVPAVQAASGSAAAPTGPSVPNGPSGPSGPNGPGDSTATGRAAATGAPAPSAATAPPPAPNAPAPASNPTAEARTEAPSKPAIPMASILSEPSGATVEINGESVGTTPLVVPGPADRPVLQVRLTLAGRKAWQGNLSPNEAGHYVLNVTLEPGR
ncbi:MAG: PEGA domain-containing protein [Deltaproteobacteria bacterium]|nr:PEGA domain-containing protein [Deltaproteobacteria bacterium]